MYNEDRPWGQMLKQFIMKLIMVIIFVLLLIWLVPWPNMDSYIKAINPLKDQIFNSNLQTMKDAGITYFTSERLPVEVGDKTTLTLQKMLDMKLLIPFTDRNGKSCDVTKSYVSLEKKETEYIMKVNLKCGEEEDYILVHLGCYSYCDGAICEKKATPQKVVATVKPTSNPTNAPAKYTCKFVNGQYWGKNSIVVSQNVYEDECVPKPTPVAEKEYEYKLETSTYYAKEFSQWSNWQEHVQLKGENINYVKTDTKEVEDLGYKYTLTEHKDAVIETIVSTHPVLAQITTAKYSVCAEKEYVVERTYTTTITETEYKVEYTGGYQLVEVSGPYQRTGNAYSGYNPPTDTASTKWVIAGINFAKCSDCINHPYLVWAEYKRNVVSTQPLTMDPTISSNTTVTENVVSSGCSQTIEKEVPVYITRQKTETKRFEREPAQDKYEWVHKYRVRTRELLRDEFTDIRIDYKWSSYNDLSLLNVGYKYTGKTRNK